MWKQKGGRGTTFKEENKNELVKGGNKELLEQAVNDWDKKEGYALDSNGELILNLAAYANIVNIPYQTLTKYVCKKDKAYRRRIGAQVGRKCLLGEDNQRFIAEVCA